RHALESHCPRTGLFAVAAGARSQESADPWPLAAPLSWLAAVLEAQDEARLERLWSLAPRDGGLLKRCVRCFVHRDPHSPVAARFRQQLQQLRRSRRRRRGLVGTAAAACLLVGLWTYDALGFRAAAGFEAEHGPDAAAVLQNWQHYRAWHPSSGLWPTS